MGSVNAPLLAFNRGVVSPLVLARTDLQAKIPWAAERQENWMPRVLGSMMLRPGLAYTGATKSNNKSFSIPFIYSTSDTARIEITNTVARIWDNDVLVTRPDVVGDVNFPVNPNFTTNLDNWVDADDAGATSAWDDGSAYGLPTSGYMRLLGTGFTSARRYQQPSVTAPNILHALRVVIARGPVTLRIGSTIGGNDLVDDIVLKTGTHSITFTPMGILMTFEFFSSATYSTFVKSAQIESAGALELPVPWTVSDLPNLRYTASGQFTYVGASGLQQYEVNRRDTATNLNNSWSVQAYQPTDGPFLIANVGNISLTPDGLNGDIGITASAALFKSTHVGALFAITSIGQKVTASLTGANQFSDPIKVVGVGTGRAYTFNISGTWVGKVTLQQSFGDTSSWVDVNQSTGNTTQNNNDGFSNQIVYYRAGIKTGEYTSGTAVVTLTYASGGLRGVARISKFTDSQTVSAYVLTAMGGTTGSTNWEEGEWSDYRGYPQAPAIFEGREWWGGNSNLDASISDAFESFDPTVTGDSGVIQKSIGEGPVANINWLLPLKRLIIGADGAEFSARSSSLDEVLTPTNVNIKAPSTLGSAAVQAVKIDTIGAFVQEGGQRVFSLSYDLYTDEVVSAELTEYCPEIGAPSIVRMQVQRMPDTRLHCVLSDGTAAVMIYNAKQEIMAWIKVTTNGVIEDVCILPGTTENAVYYTVARTINGGTVRYHEKWALETECQGGTLNKQADAFVIFTNSPASTAVSGLSHLEGQSVVVWADGRYNGTYTVVGGAITLAVAATTGIVGLTYDAIFKSTKLAYAAQAGTALTMMKRVNGIGFILYNTHYQGLKFGRDLTAPHLMDLPRTNNSTPVPVDTIYSSYDNTQSPFQGDYDTDSRMFLKASAPFPCTVLGIILSLTTNEK